MIKLYFGAYLKKGYLRIIASNNAHVMPKPYSAPAFVDWTRWETPIAVPANNKPGPSLLKVLIKCAQVNGYSGY